MGVARSRSVTAAEQPKLVLAGTASISERGTEADTKLPLADAILTLAGISGSTVLTAITDTDGWFVFEGWLQARTACPAQLSG